MGKVKAEAAEATPKRKSKRIEVDTLAEPEAEPVKVKKEKAAGSKRAKAEAEEKPSKKAKKEKSKSEDEEAVEEGPAQPTGPTDAVKKPDPNSLDNFPLSEAVKSLLRSQGIETLFPIQAQTLPPGLEGKGRQQARVACMCTCWRGVGHQATSMPGRLLWPPQACHTQLRPQSLACT